MLTTNIENTVLACVLHITANRLMDTISAVNIPSAHRVQISRKVHWLIGQRHRLRCELQPASPDAFLTKNSDMIGEQLNLITFGRFLFNSLPWMPQRRFMNYSADCDFISARSCFDTREPNANRMPINAPPNKPIAIFLR